MGKLKQQTKSSWMKWRRGWVKQKDFGPKSCLAYYGRINALYNPQQRAFIWSIGTIVVVIVIGHLYHSRKNLEHGHMFSFEEQIDHKIVFHKKRIAKYLDFYIISWTLYLVHTYLFVLYLFGLKKVLDVVISVERENHIHGFYCTEVGSLWVAQ